MELEDRLNRLTDNKYGFSYRSAVLDSSTAVCSVELFYKDGTILSPQIKDLCHSVITEYLPRGYTYKINFTKNFIAEESITDFVHNFFKNNCASITYKLASVDSHKNQINLQIDEILAEYIKSKKIVQTLIAALKEQFDVEFNVFVEYVSNMINFAKAEEEETVFEEKTVKHIDAISDECVYGKDEFSKPTYIRESKDLGKTVSICGFVREFKKSFTKPKVREGQDEAQVIEYFNNPTVPSHERKEAGQRPVYKFRLEDFTDSIVCRFYSKIDDMPHLDKIQEGSSVMICGEIVEDKFSGDLCIKPQNISLCTLPAKWEEEIDYKTEKSFYEFVSPEDMIYTDQVGFFSMADERRVPEYLQNNSIVVFDVETTGLNPYNGDKMIEIGAVKIVNGAIIQKFQSYIDPEMKIPEDSTKIHGLTNADVAGKPKAHQVLQDFYKFTRGCILSGYNVDFDLGFLRKQGKESRYNFDNPSIDVYKDMAQKFIKGGVKNYKLGTIAKHLGVGLDNAHSALFDTIATAEILIKLADNLQ